MIKEIDQLIQEVEEAFSGEELLYGRWLEIKNKWQKQTNE